MSGTDDDKEIRNPNRIRSAIKGQLSSPAYQERRSELSQLTSEISLLRKLQASSEPIPSELDEFMGFIKKQYSNEFGVFVIKNVWEKLGGFCSGSFMSKSYHSWENKQKSETVFISNDNVMDNKLCIVLSSEDEETFTCSQGKMDVVESTFASFGRKAKNSRISRKLPSNFEFPKKKSHKKYDKNYVKHHVSHTHEKVSDLIGAEIKNISNNNNGDFFEYHLMDNTNRKSHEDTDIAVYTTKKNRMNGSFVLNNSIIYNDEKEQNKLKKKRKSDCVKYKKMSFVEAEKLRNSLLLDKIIEINYCHRTKLSHSKNKYTTETFS